MTNRLSTVVLIIILVGLSPLPANAIGSGATVALSHSSGTVCGIAAEQNRQRIQCYRGGQTISILPDLSFSSISGGRNFFCGLVSGGHILLCWDISVSSWSISTKRLYFNYNKTLISIAVGDDHVCGTFNGTGVVECWRGNSLFHRPNGYDGFSEISSGFGFSCGILVDGNRVQCWGSNQVLREIESQFGNMSMSSIVAGTEHVCGLNSNGVVVCKGNNDSGQLNVPLELREELFSLALGRNYSCGIRMSNGSVVCWGFGGRDLVNDIEGISFELIVSSEDFVCGLTSRNLSVICWGPGWPQSSMAGLDLPISDVLPGPCVSSNCSCGVYLHSERLCSGSGNICKPCLNLPPPPLKPPPAPSPLAPPRPTTSKALRKGLLAFAIVGSVGAFLGICTVIYCLWTGVCFGKKKIHNSVQPTINRAGSNGTSASTNSNPLSRSCTIRRQSSRAMRRQRSGTSGSKHADSAEEFSFAKLAAATDNFSLENKIGSGSFGVVYRGKLMDGREVAIKRGETSSKAKKYQEKETAFESELAFLSRLHHKHLVRLVGYCEEKDERLLVYEYMKNGALHDHLHDKNNVEKGSSVVNSWKMRIKIALDAARGIEYLHNYAVPTIIHRDIKSSNILLDENWIARVSDFGLSLMSPEPNSDHKPSKAAGTVGYIDPEYYSLNVLTAKSDVYGLGVVLLELLTGKRAIFKNCKEEGVPVSLVDYAVPYIMNEDLSSILDPRVGPPESSDTEAVELMAYIAMHCVNLEGKERPTMSDIVANLERALALCDESHGSISSNSISIVVE